MFKLKWQPFLQYGGLKLVRMSRYDQYMNTFDHYESKKVYIITKSPEMKPKTQFLGPRSTMHLYHKILHIE